MKNITWLLMLCFSYSGYSQVVEYNGGAIGGGYVLANGDVVEAFDWVRKTDEYGDTWTRTDSPSPSFVLAKQIVPHHGLESTKYSIKWNKKTNEIIISNLSIYKFNMVVKKTEFFKNEHSFISGQLTSGTLCKGKMTVSGPLIEFPEKGKAELYFTDDSATLTFKNIEFVFHRYRSSKWGDVIK